MSFLAQVLRDDLQGFLGALQGVPVSRPGLQTWRFASAAGERRVHLRVDGDGSGTLFVDMTDVVHLNASATQLVRLALDGVSQARARGMLRAGYRDGGRAVDADVARLYAFVEQLRQPGAACVGCAVPGIAQTPLFGRRAEAPYKADVVLTYGCNNACSHCYNEPDRLGMPSLAAADWERVLDRLAAIGVPHVIFTGGEATLHPDLPAMIRHADSLGQVAGLNTNGRRLAHAPFALELREAGLNHVQVTVASSRESVHDLVNGAPGAWRQTLGGIEQARRVGLHVITNTTLCRLNADHAEEIVDFVAALGIRTFAMNATIYSGGGYGDPNAIPEHALGPLLVRVRDRALERGLKLLWYTPTEYCRLNPVELELGAKRCNAGEYSIAVEPNGDVLPCQSFYVSAGNILRDPWERIWNGDLFRSFREREEWLGEAGLPEKCWECPDLPLCGGGCRIEREAAQGRRVGGPAPPGPTPADGGFVPLAALSRRGRATGTTPDPPKACGGGGACGCAG